MIVVPVIDLDPMYEYIVSKPILYSFEQIPAPDHITGATECFGVCACFLTDFPKKEEVLSSSVDGPGPDCMFYEDNPLLTNQAIEELLYKINERRNYVAMGFSSVIPGAANMKKISWSPELAKFAQRWADQCDQSLRPDKEDDCRDLAYTKVGQNIATVIGHSPGLSVKSFVETWFMQILDYKGSVTYYNESQDFKTNYFTQLIWAETEAVGCGQAMFYIEEREMMVHRLVCNFAPKGNIHGKPVYAIGYAGTQCTENMAPDNQFKGLCHYKQHEMRKLPTQRTPVSSLLRILNLNNSVKQEIDPLRNNFKQINLNANNSLRDGHQKTRHVISNNTFDGMKRAPSFRKQNMWKSLRNMSRNDYEYIFPHPHERGHSRVYHGHDISKINAPFTQTTMYHDYRRHDYTTDVPIAFGSSNLRKHNVYQQCTRKGAPYGHVDDCRTTMCGSNHCTRGIAQGCQHSTTCQPTLQIPNPVETHGLHDSCSCSKTTCASTQRCNCNVNCPYPHAPPSTAHQCNKYTTACPRIHRMGDEDFNGDTRKSGSFHYYDMMPNVIVRSGNLKEETTPPKETTWFYDHMRNKKNFQKVHSINNNEPTYVQVTDFVDNSKDDDPERDYLYHSILDSNIRGKREGEIAVNEKPFWEIDEESDKRLPRLKSLRYTTIRRYPKKNNKKARTMKDSLDLLAEPITIKLDVANEQLYDKGQSTEKYMSFEELMHLKKFSDKYDDEDLRRQGNKNIPSIKTTNEPPITRKKTAKTQLYKGTGKIMRRDDAGTTASDTPFPRIKHCTRKLTCTWTELSLTGRPGADGDGINNGGGTLPGFQSGCSRTSTCTRVNKDRNKQSTLPVFGTGSDQPEDEDYCERRSLNVKRRNSDEEGTDLDYKEDIEIKIVLPTEDDGAITEIIDEERAVELTDDCACGPDSAKKKREILPNVNTDDGKAKCPCGCRTKRKSIHDKSSSNKSCRTKVLFLFNLIAFLVFK